MTPTIKRSLNDYLVTCDREKDTKIADSLTSTEGIEVIELRRPYYKKDESYILLNSALPKEKILDYAKAFNNLYFR